MHKRLLFFISIGLLIKPNLSFGLEYSTGQHQFQVFVTTADNIHPQGVIGENTNDFTKKRNMLIGFNITREFGF